MDASPSLSTEITANLQQVIPLESPLLSLSTHLGQWYRPCILFGNPNSILASTAHRWGTSSSQTAGSQVYHRQEKASGTCPPGPPPTPCQPYQSRGTTPLFFRARSTTEGGASTGAAPKLKSSFRGVKMGGIWLVLCGAEKQAQRQRWGQGGSLPPRVAGLPFISLRVGIRDSGAQEQSGLALQTSSQSLLRPGPSRDGQKFGER